MPIIWHPKSEYPTPFAALLAERMASVRARPRDVARWLDIIPQRVSTWLNRGTIPDTHIIRALARRFGDDEDIWFTAAGYAAPPVRREVVPRYRDTPPANHGPRPPTAAEQLVMAQYQATIDSINADTRLSEASRAYLIERALEKLGVPPRIASEWIRTGLSTELPAVEADTPAASDTPKDKPLLTNTSHSDIHTSSAPRRKRASPRAAPVSATSGRTHEK